MRAIVRLLSLVAVLGGTGVCLAAPAQSPQTTQTPQSTQDVPTPQSTPTPEQGVRWLRAVVVDPRLVARDGMQSVTAAVQLMQRATMPMQIDIELIGGTPDSGNPAMQRVACVWTYRSIYLSQRAILESFPIYTGGLQPRAGVPSAMVPKTITITARHGSERVSTSFTVNCPQ